MTSTAAPAISVVLPTFNGEAHIESAIRSILEQTFDDFELIVVDDGSTDGTRGIVNGLNDDRVRLIHCPVNRGLSAALNLGIAEANGSLIARQDQDDISHPTRLEIQYRYLQSHPHVGLVGTWARIIGASTCRGSRKTMHRHPAQPDLLKWRLLWNNPFVHSSAMFQKALFDSVGGYPERSDEFPEDYALWSRFARVSELANIAKPLVQYRQTSTSMSSVHSANIVCGVTKISVKNLIHESDGSLNAVQSEQISRALNSYPMERLGVLDAMRNARRFAILSRRILGFQMISHLPVLSRACIKVFVRSLNPANSSTPEARRIKDE